jgi:hypothetical protein
MNENFLEKIQDGLEILLKADPLNLNSKLCQLIDNLPIFFANWSVENKDNFLEFFLITL